MPVVQVKGVANPIQFPDNMSEEEIKAILQQKFNADMFKRATGELSDALTPVTNTAAPYEPTLAEKIGSGIGDALRDTGIISDNYGAQRIGKNISALAEFLPGIGDATAGDDFGRNLKAGNYGSAALDAVGTIPILGDMAIFGGVLAKNADMGALRKAKLLEDTGADRNKIWKETGWFNDKGDWKFEIDDSKSVFDIKDEALFSKKLDLDFALANDKAGAEQYRKSQELEAGLISKYGDDYASRWDDIPEAESEA